MNRQTAFVQTGFWAVPAHHAALQPDAVALVFGGQTTTDDSLPKTALGKLQRGALRARFSDRG